MQRVWQKHNAVGLGLVSSPSRSTDVRQRNALVTEKPVWKPVKRSIPLVLCQCEKAFISPKSQSQRKIFKLTVKIILVYSESSYFLKLDWKWNQFIWCNNLVLLTAASFKLHELLSILGNDQKDRRGYYSKRSRGNNFKRHFKGMFTIT